MTKHAAPRLAMRTAAAHAARRYRREGDVADMADYLMYCLWDKTLMSGFEPRRRMDKPVDLDSKGRVSFSA